MIDNTLQLILPHLRQIQTPTLWLADENAHALIEQVDHNENLTMVTNRYDIYQQAQDKNIHSIFSDFELGDYPQGRFKKIVYRISKEKAVAHHIINQAAKLLQDDGVLVISGYKQEGVKSFSSNIKKTFNAQGDLKKIGSSYLGEFSDLSSSATLDEKNYRELREIETNIYSKPGVFGWNKIDKGTELLLDCFKGLVQSGEINPETLLDLGCGYGWIFCKLDTYISEHKLDCKKAVATDNNAAAIIAATKNASLLSVQTEVTASDCANTLDEKFSLVLCNPPFHQGFQHDQSLTNKFINACAQKTKKNGHTLLVTNEFIAFDKIADALFSQKKTLLKEQGFKVIILSK